MLPGSRGVEARSNHEAAAATAEKESEFSDLAPAHIRSHRMMRSRSRCAPQPQAGSTQLSPNVKIGAHAGEAAPSFTADNNQQRTPANGHNPFGTYPDLGIGARIAASPIAPFTPGWQCPRLVRLALVSALAHCRLRGAGAWRRPPAS